MNFWKDISTGDKPPELLNMVIELVSEDEEAPDTKILSVLANDRRFEGYKDISDVHKHELTEIQEFFETYKRLEPHRWAKVKEWKNAQEALDMVKYSMEKYRKLANK